MLLDYGVYVLYEWMFVLKSVQYYNSIVYFGLPSFFPCDYIIRNSWVTLNANKMVNTKLVCLNIKWNFAEEE